MQDVNENSLRVNFKEYILSKFHWDKLANEK